MTTLTVVELVVAVFLLLAATWELAQLAQARRQGLTENVTRVFTHSVVLGLVLVYIGYVLYWWRLMELAPYLEATDPVATTNWPMLILGILVCLLLVLEVQSHFAAWRGGLTENWTRLVVHLAMLAALVGLLYLSVVKWDLYLEEIGATYEESIPSRP